MSSGGLPPVYLGGEISVPCRYTPLPSLRHCVMQIPKQKPLTRVTLETKSKTLKASSTPATSAAEYDADEKLGNADFSSKITDSLNLDTNNIGSKVQDVVGDIDKSKIGEKDIKGNKGKGGKWDGRGSGHGNHGGSRGGHCEYSVSRCIGYYRYGGYWDWDGTCDNELVGSISYRPRFYWGQRFRYFYLYQNDFRRL
ncbi:hypothetical protein BB560_001998 [Smittium megazygosporum]|uniref:Uncharacterized protein n=1 Tax=Smittium megazygosporum TaxID=133381 RepID=A0A2T9ZFY7_9FUNG|nr:hypothetical protein BB560_001998 [Smittium megazygosporum]